MFYHVVMYSKERINIHFKIIKMKVSKYHNSYSVNPFAADNTPMCG